MTQTSIDAALARLALLHPRRIDLSLGRMTRLLAALGNPERNIPPVIHIAGTNGKGSTLAFLRAILEASGRSVHAYTSPHLVRVNERFRVAGKLATDDALNEALARCEQANAGADITLFEIQTAAAFVLFAEMPADITLLEVGLGGRLDATNVIDVPLACVIAPVGIDHTEFLGDTLAAIAGEKAGIIKRGIPVISAMQAPDALAAIEAVARQRRAPLHVAGEHWHAGEERGRLVYQDERGLLDLAAPRLFGRHQFDNAGLAIATLRAIEGLRIETSAYEAGVARAEWPARMQRLVSGALTSVAPVGSEIWLDGGHNPDGGRVVAAALGELEERVPRPLVVIAGMLANKDAQGFLANFAGQTRHIIAVPVPGTDAGMTPSDLAESARALGMRVEVTNDIATALAALTRLAYETPPRILITGSLYLAGDVLRASGTMPV